MSIPLETMDIKIKFGWNKGIRVITEMNISMDTKYVVNDPEFVQRLGDAINKVVNHENEDSELKEE